MQIAKQHVCIQDGIIEASNASLILQNLHLKKLNAQLHKKENDRGADCTTLFPNGQVRVFTGADFIEDARQMDEEKK